MRDHGSSLFKQAREELAAAGLLLKTKEEDEGEDADKTEKCIDRELQQLGENSGGKLSTEEALSRLERLRGRCAALKHGPAKASRIKKIRAQIEKLKASRRADAEAKEKQKDEEDDEDDDEESENANQDHESDDDDEEEEELKGSGTAASSGTSPTGVNRRTAVLFTRKAQAALRKPESPSKEITTIDHHQGGPPPAKMPRRRGRTKKAHHQHNITKQKDPKKEDESKTEAEPKVDQVGVAKDKERTVSDSFKVYRSAHSHSSNDDETDSNSSVSTCYSHDESDVESSESESCPSDDNATTNTSTTTTAWRYSSDLQHQLRPLRLVWAKCRGYPWYPALIIDPGMPCGFAHRGVPIPAPPQDVVALAANYAGPVYLVLFFDAKRTWQWLPPDKLEPLGVQAALDEVKMSEPRKPADRKAVRKAYMHALSHRTQVDDETTEKDGGTGNSASPVNNGDNNGGAAAAAAADVT